MTSLAARPSVGFDPTRDKSYRSARLGRDVVDWLAWLELGGTAPLTLDSYERVRGDRLIAALYVETNGVYYGLPDVDPWDEARDARLYEGPWPVVAHPPCNRWSRAATFHRQRDGQDGGCFERALTAVNEYGGVLEHPAQSLAWEHFGLPKPSVGGWTESLLLGGLTTEVDQRWYGHEARKPTWLYYVGPKPTSFRWGRGPASTISIGKNYGGGKKRQAARSRTPPAFRDVLLDMARSASRADARGLATEERTGASSC